jgi:hypothetical protein
MNKFLKYFVIICALTAVFWIGAGKIIDHGLIQLDKSRYQEWEAIAGGGINADVVILGSSRGVSGYNPQIIGEGLRKKTYNLSYDAGSFALQASKFDLYLENNKTPKIIIQNIDFTHFAANDTLIGENNMLPFRENDLFKTHFAGYENHIFEPWNLFSIKYTRNFRLIRKGLYGYFGVYDGHNLHDNGFVSKDEVFKKDQRNLVALKKTVKARKYAYLLRNVEIVKKSMVSYSIKSKVVVVWAPEYIERYALAPELHAIISEQFRTLASRYPNITFIDLSDHAMGKEAVNFYDTFHLNSTGSTTFSTLLVPYLAP